MVTSGEPFTWTNPGGVTKIVYEIYGGGGGACHSAGGGSGAACMGVLNVAGVHSISGYLGGGGWGGACNSLGFGQASMFSFPGGGSCYAGGGTMGTGGMAAWAYGGQINIPGGTTNSITGAGNMRAPSTGDGQGSACGGGGGHSSPWGDAGGAGCVIFWEY